MTDLIAPEREPSPPRPSRPPNRKRKPGPGLFRAVWRWHFYASFLVVPVLLVLATTGLIYLFRFQLEPLLHADLMKVDGTVGRRCGPAAVRRPAGAPSSVAYPDATVVSMAEPRDGGPQHGLLVVDADGAARDVFVDPYGPRCSARSTRTRPCRARRAPARRADGRHAGATT